MTAESSVADYTLFLDRSRTARAFDPKESLWTPELTQIFELINSQLGALSSESETTAPPLLSIAVFGTHGSGKTSLLHTLRDRIENPNTLLKPETETQAPSDEEQDLRDSFEKLQGRVATLPVLKPNLLAEESESFLYSVLAAAVEAEQEQHHKQKHQARRTERTAPTGSSYDAGPGYASDRFLTPVQQAFQEVSEYLQVIDQAGRKTHEHDPLGVSLERLERHTSDLRLREHMKKLLEVLTTQLTGRSPDSVLLLPVDDADMSKGSITRTLDTYRRYLLHPRLVPVFTFTGRLSEELLSSHFSDRLGGDPKRSRDSEAHDEFKEQIAFQYLARLFPVRNRIRLGATTVRVQEADYQVRSPSTRRLIVETIETDATQERVVERERRVEVSDYTEPRPVMDLLETGSKLLFGYPQWLTEPRVDLPLRPPRLRRQLQILDALHSVGVTGVVEDAERKRSQTRQNGPEAEVQLERLSQELRISSERWADIFEKATWAVLDVHRDVLKELDLHLDELYGWPSRSLREWLLSTMLRQKLEDRHTLLEGWRYRTENRRGQIVSLLVANAFRPALHHREEIPGQEPLTGLSKARVARRVNPDQRHHLTPAKGLLWFLNLWLGFYLPMVLARNRKVRDSESRTEPLHGVGWRVNGGPAQAIREALINNEIYSTGMMFVDDEVVDRQLGSGRSDDDFEVGDEGRTAIMILIWCFYGHEKGRPWAAVSLWRGLALIGKLLQAQERFRAELSTGEVSEDLKEAKKDKVRVLIKEHFQSAWIPSSLKPQREARDESQSDKARKFFNPLAEWNSSSKTHEDGNAALETTANDLVDKTITWMEKWDDPARALDPLTPRKTLAAYLRDLDILHGTDAQDGPAEGQFSYDTCMLRRLHGDDLLGDLWPRLEKVYFEIDKANEQASNLLSKWMEVLQAYWQFEPILDILETCPFLKPFAGTTDQFLQGSFKRGGFWSLAAAKETPGGDPDNREERDEVAGTNDTDEDAANSEEKDA